MFFGRKGYIGVNVKMVIFNIGIRVDYFYFCNIKVEEINKSIIELFKDFR